jgi:hypothetical protein
MSHKDIIIDLLKGLKKYFLLFDDWTRICHFLVRVFPIKLGKIPFA